MKSWCVLFSTLRTMMVGQGEASSDNASTCQIYPVSYNTWYSVRCHFKELKAACPWTTCPQLELKLQPGNPVPHRLKLKFISALVLKLLLNRQISNENLKD